MITGQGDIAMEVEAMRAGASDSMKKTFERGRLLTSVAHAVERPRDANGRSASWESAATRAALG